MSIRLWYDGQLLRGSPWGGDNYGYRLLLLYIVPTICLLIVFVLCLHLIIISVFSFFFYFRRGGTSEERENMLLRGQGMVGNQDTIPCGLLGGLVGGLID